MITSLKQDIKKKGYNFLESDLNKYLVNKNQIAEYSKQIWFKGSRYR